MTNDSSLSTASSGHPLPAAKTGDNTVAKTIALVIHALHGGGAERLMSQLAGRWSQAGHQIHLITLAAVSTDQYAVPSEVIRHGLDLMKPSRSPWVAVHANWQRVFRLRQLLKALRPETLVSFCDRMNVVAITAALPLAMPIWIAEHSDPARQHLGLFWETWRQWSYRQLARRTSAATNTEQVDSASGGCVALTQPIADQLSQRFPGLNIQIIPPAVDLSQCTNTITQDTQPARRVLFVGRHSSEKNLEALLAAWQVVADRFPDWRLTLAGDGPVRCILEAQVQRLGIPRVELPGWVAQPEQLLSDSQLFVLPSKYEGFPVALLEALQSGVPCISAPSCWAVQQLASQGAVQLSSDASAAALAVTLTAALADSTARAQLAARGQSAAQAYTWPIIGPMWDRLLLGKTQIASAGRP